MYVILAFRKDVLKVKYKLGIHCINDINNYKTRYMDGRTDKHSGKKKWSLGGERGRHKGWNKSKERTYFLKENSKNGKRS